MIHAAVPSKFVDITSDHAVWRFYEYEWLATDVLAALCGAGSIAVLICQAVQKL